MLVLRDKNRKKIAYLENAFDIKEDLKINSINYVNFSLPVEDDKNRLIEPFSLVETENGLYRVLPQKLDSDEVDIYRYEAEHVIATLIDTSIFGSVIYGNLGIYTEDVIRFILGKQNVKHWRLGECDFNRQFEYAWENETLATALFSVPKPISKDYMWVYDTTNYPWTIHLKKLEKEEKPSLYIRPKKNQIRLARTSDAKQICTRLYPKGYGEGINQLTIKDVNDGVPYLQSPQPYIDKYGIIERIWIDRRYENAQSLKDAGQVLLDELQELITEYDVDFQAIDHHDRVELGKTVRIYSADNDIRDDIIVGIKINHDDIEESKITISNNGKSIPMSLADLADRQRIESAYSQGATQLYGHSLQVNADSRSGAILDFYIPSEMRIVNKVLAKIKVDRFRAFSKATEGGGKTSKTTASGGSSTPTSDWGGASYPSTNTEPTKSRTSGPYYMGGESIQAENDNYHWGTHDHGIPQGVRWETSWGTVGWVPSGAHSHGSHDHDFTIPGHDHYVKMGQHRHEVVIKPHEHPFTLPDHEHKIIPGIYRFGNPNGFELKVNRKSKGYYDIRNLEIDITELLLNKKNKISRGTWHSVEIVPNDLAYISITLTIQGFVQSRGDYTV